MKLGELLARHRGRLTFSVAEDPAARVVVDQALYDKLRESCDWSVASDDMTDHALGWIEQLANDGDDRVKLERV